MSGAEQGRTGTSLEAQSEEIRRYCRDRGHPAPDIRVEVESAGAEKLARRAVLRRLLAEVVDGDLVVVSKQDRWSRDTLFYLQSIRDLTARGARFFSIAERFDPDTPEGRFAATIMAAVAEQERERIRERTVGRRKQLRDEGRYVEGLPPIGYERGHGNILQPVPADVAIVRDVYTRCAAGESIAAIQQHLRATHPGRHGWDRGCIRKMLRSRIYLGEVTTSARVWVPSHEAVVDLATWQAAQDGLDARRLGGRPTGAESRTRNWLLRGIATCAACGGTMGSAYSGSLEWSYYACWGRLLRKQRQARGGVVCDAAYVPVQLADEAATPLVLARLDELRHLLTAQAEPPPAPVGDRSSKLARIEARRARFIDLAGDGTITPAELRERLSRLDDQRARLLEDARAERRAERARDPHVRRELLGTVNGLRRAWKRASVPQRRDVVELLASAVRLAKGEAPAFDWHSVEELTTEP